ncbi:MAG: hypothetical protein LC798_01800 [Chloroflexi bacterium]|nr:hypothetical protein [Chloroflexota bacterium]
MLLAVAVVRRGARIGVDVELVDAGLGVSRCRGALAWVGRAGGLVGELLAARARLFAQRERRDGVLAVTDDSELLKLVELTAPSSPIRGSSSAMRSSAAAAGPAYMRS